MAKTTRAQAAARGTKLDDERSIRPVDAVEKPKRAARPQSKHEARTAKIFTTVQVIMVVVPLAMIGYVWMVGGGSISALQDAME